MTKQRVLFLCTGNSCRSQMAEGWLRHLAGGRYEVFSAGVETHGLNPRAVQVMAEAGVDIAHHTSDLVDDYLQQPMDCFITVCDHAAESCPRTPPGSVTLHWSFPDPPGMVREQGLSGEAELQVYRDVRDRIKAAVEGFLAERATG